MNTSSPFQLSFATINDREQLLRLHKTCRYETGLPLVPDYAQATLDRGYYEKLWRNNFPSADQHMRVIKADLPGSLIGFCRFGKLDEEEYFKEKLGEYSAGLSELHQIYVYKEFRKKLEVDQLFIMQRSNN